MIPPTRSSDDAGGSGAEQVPTFSQELQVPDRRLNRVWVKALAAAGSSRLPHMVGGATEERCCCREALERP